MRLILFCGLTFFVFAILFVGLLHFKTSLILVEPLQLTFRIERNEPLRSISRRLKEKNLIISSQLFEIGARFKKLDKIIKYGEFTLSNDMSINEVLTKVTSNMTIGHRVFIRECITSWEIIKIFKQKDFLTDNLSTHVLPEGVFSPDTYTVSYQTNFSDLLELMRLKQTETLHREWIRRKSGLPIKNKFELLILASIIEKEASSTAEMYLISSVFTNRLRKGMRLQSDPTAIYGLDFGNLANRKPLRREDLRIINAHNTYRISGLPLSPICNPSKNAIRAAANPTTTNYLYFVMSEFGKHVFSKTFEEHKKNVINWRRFIKR